VNTAKTREINAAYAQSFCWVSLLVAFAVQVAIVVELVFVDFIHGNPHRPKTNALLMMATFPAILGIVAIIGTFLTFTLPQCFQAILSHLFERQVGRRGQFGVLLALPLTAALAWYCYDYLTPTDVNLGINTDADWIPYQHGLTVKRYLVMLMIQTPITLFSLAYRDAAMRGDSKRPALLLALLLAVIIGVVVGYEMARNQYQFL
jgi:hypothetical protein